MTGNNTVAINQKAVVYNRFNFFVVGNDEGMVAFSRTAGPDKPDYLHLLFAFP